MIYYAFKQSESDDDDGGTASTGWEILLNHSGLWETLRAKLAG